MSRSGGGEAQGHVGEGQVGVVGTVWVWKVVVGIERRDRDVEMWRRWSIHGAGARERRANVNDIVVVVEE